MKRAGQGRGHALVVLAVCFIASGILRTGDVVAALPESRVTEGAEAPANPQPAAVPEPGTLASALLAKQQRIAAREAALDERESALDLVESRLRERLAELIQARRELEETAALVDDAAGKDVKHLVAMYEQMKPKQAGQIFDAMAPGFAAGFLGQMNAQSAALILASMEPEKAYSVSVLLAGRNVAAN